MKILLFAASLRKDSFNKKLICLAANAFKNKGCEIDLANFKEFEVPLYDADLNESEGLPEGAKLFIQKMQQADATVIASPEYNFSTPGTLKNLIDWVSRQSPMPFSNQQFLLMSASPSLVGGNRGLWATRVPLEACGAFIYPDMFSLASAHTAFDDQNFLKDQTLQTRLEENIKNFVDYLKKQ